MSGSLQSPEIRESAVSHGPIGFATEETPFRLAALSLFSGVDMPAIIRWFPVSHDINSDPEMWELREKFGDRAGFVWLEILSIADRNNGILGPSSPQLYTILAGRCRVYSPKVRAILEWCLVKGWLILDSNLRVAKWLKYHRTREPNKNPSGNTTTPLLSYPSEPSSKKKIPDPVDNSKEELKVIFDLAATLVDGNSDKFTDVKNWIGKTIREAQGSVDRAKPELTRKIILRSIQALKKLGTGNLDRDGVFAYLTGAFKKIRTEEIQGESAKYKQGGIESAGEILQRMKTESK